MKINRDDTRTPRHLQDRAQELRDKADGVIDERVRRHLQSLARELEDQARRASRPR